MVSKCKLRLLEPDAGPGQAGAGPETEVNKPLSKQIQN